MYYECTCGFASMSAGRDALCIACPKCGGVAVRRLHAASCAVTNCAAPIPRSQLICERCREELLAGMPRPAGTVSVRRIFLAGLLVVGAILGTAIFLKVT